MLSFASVPNSTRWEILTAAFVMLGVLTMSNERSTSMAIPLGIAGAIGGAVVGSIIFIVALQSGFYALALPGALIGLGCGALSRIRSIPLGIFCAILAVAVGIGLESKMRPFTLDDSLAYFLTHLHKLTPFTFGMLAIGGLFGFWFGRGR